MRVTTREIFLFSLKNFYKGAIGIISIGFLVLALFIIGINWNSFAPESRNTLILAVALGGTAQVFMIFKRSEKQAKSPANQRDIYMKLDSQGIRVQQGREKGEVSWDQIIKAERISDFYVLYLSKGQAYLVPGLCLVGNRKARFLDLLKQHLDADRRKKL